MPSSATRKNSASASAKKKLTAAQKNDIRKSLEQFNTLRKTLRRKYSNFNASKPPSQEAMLAVLKAMAR